MRSVQRPTTVGFITPPRWHDPAPHEFSHVCGVAVRTQQSILPLPDFDYRLETIGHVDTSAALAVQARLLASAECDLVVQVGTPFAWAGTTSEAEARARGEALEQAAGVPVIMTGLALIDALRALGARRPALACTYYDAAWRDGWAAFVARCGFEPAHVATMADQGLVQPGDTLARYGFAMSEELAQASVERTATAAPEADAIVVTGTGTRTLWLAPVLERVLGRPIVGADTVGYWVAARLLGLPLGHSLGTLGDASLPART